MTNRRNFIRNSSAIAIGVLANGLFFNNKILSKVTPNKKILATENPFQNPPLFNTSEVMMIFEGSKELISGAQSNVISFSGSHPAPTIKVKQGDNLSVSFHNMLNVNTNIHWHGIYVPDNMDGHPSNFLKPMQAFTYEYQIIQRAGTYYYHSHVHMATAKQVYNGMYGFLIIEDDEESKLNLPSGEFEMLMAIQDVRIGTSNTLIYSPNTLDKMEGWMGNRVMVNGILNSVKKVSKDSYRLRLINASNARFYKLAFDDNRTFHIIGTDGGLLEAPVELNSIMLAPAERLDIIVSFNNDNIGASAKLISESFDPPLGHMGKPAYPQGIELEIIRFDITEEQNSAFSLPQKLSVIQRIPSEEAVKTRKFELQMQMMSMKHTINNKLYNIDRIDETINFGDTEIWEFINKDMDMMHPIHIHGLQFQILERSLQTSLPEHEKGWKDTFIINEGETVKVIAKFNGYKGKYLLHCHNLEHEDDGMMLNYLVSETSSTEDFINSNLYLSPNPASDYVNISNISPADLKSVRIYNSSGILVENIKSEMTNNTLRINLNNFSNGNYFITIGNRSLKFIVMK